MFSWMHICTILTNVTRLIELASLTGLNTRLLGETSLG